MNAAKRLPEIHRLLLTGENAEAEALVNQTFTCKGAGSGRGGGARVPFGYDQALGDLSIVWKSDAESAFGVVRTVAALVQSIVAETVLLRHAW